MITLYTKPQCPYCDNAKSWLENNSVPYETVDITENKEAYEFIKGEGHRSVPQIYHDGELLISGGYSSLIKQDPKIIKERMGYRDAA